jgi:uncharacterized Zn-binding protein involved in type VI secretion
MKVAVNPPKTPVTDGSNDVATAATPNVCKMPGPPAPFITSPLPNVGKSGDGMKKGTTTVLIEGHKVAVEGTYYMSMGDIASKATGGGFVSATTHGKTEFTAPGSMDVKAQGKNVQLLGDAMTNNSTNGGATVPGNVQATQEFRDRLGDAEAADALCRAACKALEEKKDPKNKTAKNQSLLRKHLDPKAAGEAGKRGAGLGESAGLSKGVLTEVAQKVGSAGEFCGKWGAEVAKRGAELFVKWDIVLTTTAPGNAVGLLTNIMSDKIFKIVEVKFDDTPTPNQDAAKDQMTPEQQEKFEEMYVHEDCICK